VQQKRQRARFFKRIEIKEIGGNPLTSTFIKHHFFFDSASTPKPRLSAFLLHKKPKSEIVCFQIPELALKFE